MTEWFKSVDIWQVCSYHKVGSGGIWYLIDYAGIFFFILHLYWFVSLFILFGLLVFWYKRQSVIVNAAFEFWVFWWMIYMISVKNSTFLPSNRWCIIKKNFYLRAEVEEVENVWPDLHPIHDGFSLRKQTKYGSPSFTNIDFIFGRLIINPILIEVHLDFYFVYFFSSQGFFERIKSGPI